MAKTKAIEADVVIAGGGTVGMSLALSLAKLSSLKIVVVEAYAHDFTQQHPGFDGRSVALSAHSCDWFEQHGVQLEDVSCPIHHIHVSDRGHLGQCTMSATEFNIPALGSVVELPVLGAQINQQLQQAKNSNIHWLCPDQITAVNYTAENVGIVTKEGVEVKASLLVVAEGSQSPTLTMINIQSVSTSYDQCALIANVELKGAHNNWAYERFTADGPLALLPLTPNQANNKDRCSLVWTIPPSRSAELPSMADKDFLQQLKTAFGYRLGDIVRVGERVCYPLALTHAQQITAHRTAIIGNAAQMLHPIAGQGLNLGIRDVECLANTLSKAVADSEDIGGYSTLRRYKTSRVDDRDTVMKATDSLVRIFSNHFFPFVVGRNLGLLALEKFPAIKAKLAEQAMGLKQSQLMNGNE